MALPPNRSFFDDVGEFHRRFGLPHLGDGRPPELLATDVLAFRLGFIAEELAEFCRAHSRGDLAGCLDALNDLAYVIAGLGHFMALPFDDGWREVHAANMTKISAAGVDDPRSKRNHRFDIVKPDDFRPPSHDPALIRAAIDALGLDPRAVVHFRGKTFAEFMASEFVRSVTAKEATE